MGCSDALSQWQRVVKGPIRGNVASLQKKLLELQRKDRLEVCIGEKQIQKELHILLNQEDLRWRQRAKAEWLKYRDKNTKYYHACANSRRKINLIS